MDELKKELLSFIEESPSAFHSIESIKKELLANSFKELKEHEKWDFKFGRFFVTRNNSSIIAFDIPKTIKDYHFQVVSSHSDSPCFKLKANPIIEKGNVITLDTESYGGMIDYTWFDKPLTIAGRVFVKENQKLSQRLIYIDDDLLIIPSVAIHMNRDVNKGYSFNRAVDLCPLFASGSFKKNDFESFLADKLNVNEADIVSFDLNLVNRQKGTVFGYADEFIASPKLDDLEAAFTSLKAFVLSKDSGAIKVYACFDNEEVGSNTKQGAMSTFLKDCLKRINLVLGYSECDYYEAVARSFNISFDNAHAVHPNHPELTDPLNVPEMNKGIVIKENAAQHYTTDAFSRAVMIEICKKAKVPYQLFANRSDKAGGGTLGNISNVQVSMHCVDIGLAQLAMHSAYETAGAKDVKYAVDALLSYYEALLLIDGTNCISVD